MPKDKMIKKILTTFFFLFLGILSANAQNIYGKWKTVDDNTGETKGVVEFFEENGKAYGRVIKILHPDPEKQKERCNRCRDERKGELVLGMVVIRDLKQNGKYYGGGKVLDPENGREYQCYAKLLGDNRLKLRGYLGIPLIGRTQYWYRDN